MILGTLRMPALVRSVGLDVRRAAGTNLVVGFLLGLAGFAVRVASLRVDWAVLTAGLAGALQQRRGADPLLPVVPGPRQPDRAGYRRDAPHCLGSRHPQALQELALNQ